MLCRSAPPTASIETRASAHGCWGCPKEDFTAGRGGGFRRRGQASDPAVEADITAVCSLSVKIGIGLWRGFDQKVEFASRTPDISLAESPDNIMATPNYQFEKRRREMEKKAKKEEKRKRKLESGTQSEPVTDGSPPAPAATT